LKFDLLKPLDAVFSKLGAAKAAKYFCAIAEHERSQWNFGGFQGAFGRHGTILGIWF
jgi:hypothetical protein